MSERALVRNAGDRKQVKRAAKTERQTAVEEAGHLESVLTTYDGRALLWRILGHAGVYEQSYRGEATHETSFQEGKRSVGNWLNDASKSRPEWVRALAKEWGRTSKTAETAWIVRHALRTLRKGGS